MLPWQVLTVVGVPSKMSACMEIDHVRLRALPPRVLACVRVLVLRKRWGSEGSGLRRVSVWPVSLSRLFLLCVCSLPRRVPCLPCSLAWHCSRRSLLLSLLHPVSSLLPPPLSLPCPSLVPPLSLPCPSLPFSAPCLSVLLAQIKELERTGYNAVVMLAAARCVSGRAAAVRQAVCISCWLLCWLQKSLSLASVLTCVDSVSLAVV
jgi:hypothetical protein